MKAELENQEELLNALKRLQKNVGSSAFSEIFNRYHMLDIAIAFDALLITERIKIVRTISEKEAARILEYAAIETQEYIFLEIKVAKGCDILAEMSVDEALKILRALQQEFPQKYKSYYIGLKNKKNALPIIEQLDENATDTAASIMHTNFFSLPENLNIAQAITLIREKKFEDHHVSFYVFIVAANNRLKGYINLRQLLVGSPQKKINELLKEAVFVKEDDDLEEVAQLVRRYDLVVLPVVNEFHNLVGVITEDDIVDVVVEEATEDLYRLSGTADIQENELVHGSVFRAIWSRLPWLLLSMVGGLVGVVIMTQFEKAVLSEELALGLVFGFVPLIMGLSGNIANQSATIVVRALSTGTLKLSSVSKYMIRETFVGLCLGVCLISFITVLLLSFNINAVFVFWIAVTVLLNALLSVFIGGALPFLFKLLKIDPAISSAPFISTTLDILGQLSYFYILYSFWIKP